MVSMKDIAQCCGVSVATVSKALNGQPDIGTETKERIIKVADELGYMTNSSARALKTNRSYNLGVLFVDEGSRGLTHEYFAAVLNSFKTEAEKKGYDITFIGGTGTVNNRKTSCLKHCMYRGVDGLLIACTDFYSPQVTELVTSALPVLTIDHVFPNKPSVLSDNVEGEAALVRYAHSLGHKKIAFITGETRSAVTVNRLKGYSRAMEELGLEIPEICIQRGLYYEPDTAFSITNTLLKAEDRPTCILYPDDFSLVGGMRAIHELGLRVPEDISVAGYDGIIVSQVMSPRFTTYRQDTAQIGQTAARRLIDLIEHPDTASNDTAYVSGRLEKGESIRAIV